MIFRLLGIIGSILLLGSCTTLGNVDKREPKSVTIAYLKSLCAGDHYRIVDDYVVRGVVVATDWLGEMNKSAIIVDDSGGLEFALDIYNVGERLPIYSEVEIFCNGLMLARVGGKIELGAPPTGDFLLDNIDETMLDRYIRIVGICSDFAPPVKQFAALGVEDIGSLVRFDNVRLCDEEQGLSWCDVVDNEVVTTYRTFIDSEGNTLALRTLATCYYATEPMPTKEISVIGIVDYSDNRYFLRVVNKLFI